MKKIILSVFFIFWMVGSVIAQTYSTGTVVFFGDYSGKIDVTSATVTLTLIGPSTSWLGVGFNAAGMNDVGMDGVIFDGTNMTDRTFDGVGIEPPLDAIQNWSVSSNTIVSGVRTVVATRVRDTGDANDYVFPASAQPLNIIFARRPGSLVVAYHGLGNCGATTVNFTLGTEDYVLSKFKMYPNPSNVNTTIELPNGIEDAKMVIFDWLGRVIKKQSITTIDNSFETSSLQKGSYMIQVRTQDGAASKILIVN